MKSAYRIIVETRKVKYDFQIKRNITIFTGDSGSGKTVLIDFRCFHTAFMKYTGSASQENFMKQNKSIMRSIICMEKYRRKKELIRNL